MNKKIYILCTLFLFLTLLNGCSSNSTRYFYDINDYDEIWELSGYGFKEDGPLPIFPTMIKNLSVKDFYCRYDELIPLGEKIQIYLHINFENNHEFEIEKKRIMSVAFNCNEYFDNSNFIPFILKTEENYTLEYALLDEKNLEIYYIYIKNLSENDIDFDSKLLPNVHITKELFL